MTARFHDQSRILGLRGRFGDPLRRRPQPRAVNSRDMIIASALRKAEGEDEVVVETYLHVRDDALDRTAGRELNDNENHQHDPEQGRDHQ